MRVEPSGGFIGPRALLVRNIKNGIDKDFKYFMRTTLFSHLNQFGLHEHLSPTLWGLEWAQAVGPWPHEGLTKIFNVLFGTISLLISTS